MPIPQPRQPGQRLQGFAQTHVVGQHRPKSALSQMTQKIESTLLIGPQLSLDRGRNLDLGHALKFGKALSQGLAGGRFIQPSERGVIQVHRLRHGHPLRTGAQILQSQIGNRLVRTPYRLRIQFHPPAVRQLDEPARGRLQASQIRRGQPKPLRLPRCRYGEPVDSTSLHLQLGFQRSGI